MGGVGTFGVVAWVHEVAVTPGELLADADLIIGTSQSTLPVGAGRFGRAPHIAHSGAFLALRAPDCNGWPRDGLGDNGAIGTQEEPAVFRRNTRALRVLRDSGPVKRKGRSLPHHSPRYTTRRAAVLRDCSLPSDGDANSAPREGTRPTSAHPCKCKSFQVTLL